MGYADDSYLEFRKENEKRKEMVYVGSNGGMLHGFLSKGDERFAYVPRGSFIGSKNGLISLTDPAYTHRYFVDGSPFSGDYQVSSGGSWKTVLIGTMGLGGRGFFAINITKPDSWLASPEEAAKNILFDKTDDFAPSAAVGSLSAARWEDIGHIVTPAAKAPGNPNRITQITKLSNGRWAVLLGNGVNSGTEKASLLIQFLDGDRELVKIEADSTPGAGNGLSTPTAVDLDGDRKTDVVYAGDIKGNLWKFDLSENSPSRWKVSFDGRPLFVARSSGGRAQPITTAPSYVNNGAGGLNLVFGTGRNLTRNDPNNTEQQTIYSVWDNSKAVISRNEDGSLKGMVLKEGKTIGGRSELLRREVDGLISSDKGSFATTDSKVSVKYEGPGDTQRGWLFDLPFSGERVLDNSTVVIKSLVYIPSVQPTSNRSAKEENCDYQVKTAHYGLFLDGITGLPYMQRPLFDTNGDGVLDSKDVAKASRIYVGADPVMLLNIKGKLGEQRFALVPSKPGGNTADLKCNAEGCDAYTKAGGASGKVQFGILNNSVGIGWRQLQ
jgi:type IV pilus assembly protein PilY1